MSELHGFDDFMAERGLAANTISSYSSDILQLLDTSKKKATAITANDIRSFIAHRMFEVSASTARRQLVSLKTFFSYLLDESLIDADPSSLIAPVKARQRIVLPPSQQEIETMLEGIELTAHGLRDRAMILTLYGSGLRVSELTHLRIPDLDFERGLMLVRMGKGKKDRIAPMNEAQGQAIREWLASRHLIAREDSGDLLFIGPHHEPLTRQRVCQIVWDIAHRTIGKKVSPHKLRHAFCTDMVNGGCDVRVAQVMLGHASLATTQRYLHTTIEDLQREYMKFHPRSTNA